MRKLYFFVDDDRFSAPQLLLAFQKEKIKTILDLRTSNISKRLSLKLIKAQAKVRKVLVCQETSAQNIDTTALAGLLSSSHFRWPLVLLVEATFHDPLLESIHLNKLAELFQIVLKGFKHELKQFTISHADDEKNQINKTTTTINKNVHISSKKKQVAHQNQNQNKNIINNVNLENQTEEIFIPPSYTADPLIEKKDMSHINRQLAKYELPRDPENPEYVHTFQPFEHDDILKFFNHYGVVCVKVISEQDASDTVRDIISILENNSNFRWRDPNTWNSWPRDGNRRYGMPSNNPVLSTRALKNRQNKNIADIFSVLYSCSPGELMTNLDRYSIMRPTRHPKIGNKPEWMSPYNVHLDLNPWQYIGRGSIRASMKVEYDEPHKFISENHRVVTGSRESHYQALINLNDNREQDGGFVCVPGFHHFFREWTMNTKPLKGFQIRFPHGHWIYERSQRVPVPRGCIIIWNQLVAHGSKYNESERYRAAQYLKVFPKRYLNFKTRAIRRKYLNTLVTNLDEMSALGESMYDLGGRI